MLNLAEENLVSKILAFGTALTTIFVVTDGVTDPVNVTKLLVLSVTGFSAFGLVVGLGLKSTLKNFKLVWFFVTLFLTASVMSIIFSQSPFSQGLYGAYGRNNGLIAYLSLSMILLSTLTLKLGSSFERLVKALLFAGVVNVFYCLWVIAFGDFLSWNNPYGNILGTLGNPNFIGAFLGIFISVSLGYVLNPAAPKWLRNLLLVLIPITAYEIYDSHAIQGRVVGVLGIGIVGFFYIRSKFRNWVTLTYIAIGSLIGFIALLGALQIGPLTSIIYKTSVSLRGQYWLAGWNTGQNHPLSGVGMDAFGDWYRRGRDIHALELPGVNVVVNAAHNVPIDMFAFGGWPLFISYLGIMSLGGWALVRSTLRSKQYDPILAVLAAAWFGYQLQSIISINQIGLAIWGWLLTGAVIAYEKTTRADLKPSEKILSKEKQKVKSNDRVERLVLISTFSALVGLIIAIPPLTADSKWRSAQQGSTIQGIEASMESSYFNPQNSTKYLSNIQTLEQNQLFDLSHKYALEAIKWNPESYDSWRALYFVKNSTVEEKTLALANMRSLDPLNPDVTLVK